MKAIILAAFAVVSAGSAGASTFTLDVVGSCELSAPTVSVAGGISSADAKTCNNLSGGLTGALLGSRNVGYTHDADYDGISSSVGAKTETTDIPSTQNTGATAQIDTTNATDTLSFSGGPSSFELLIELDYFTNVTSTVSSASFISFSFGAQRLGGTGGMASDTFKVVDYASRPDLEIFDVDPIRLSINNGATVSLSAALVAQATASSIAGTNDNDVALAEGNFKWSVIVPDGVTIVSSSGFDYNAQAAMPAVPLPAGGILLMSGLALLARRAKSRS